MHRNNDNVIETASRLLHVRSALYMPASNPRAMAKAATLSADLILFDLEDSVADGDKNMARDAAVLETKQDFGGRMNAIRANGFLSPHHADDIRAISDSDADCIVLPKVENAADLDQVAKLCAKPVIAMIETGAGLYAARDIAAHPAVIGLFAGTNDLAEEIGIDLNQGRAGLALALQMMVLAARSSGKAVFDGVNNNLDDMTALTEEAREARQFGFTGKTLIHPRQIEPANRIFAATSVQLDDARALVEAAKGGAERFRGRMVETMHVRAAEMILARHDALQNSGQG